MRAFAAFEKTYLSKSLSRLFDLVNQMFASSTRGPPSDFEVTAFVKAIHLWALFLVQFAVEYVEGMYNATGMHVTVLVCVCACMRTCVCGSTSVHCIVCCIFCLAESSVEV